MSTTTTVTRLCMCCSERLTKTVDASLSEEDIESALLTRAEHCCWHVLPKSDRRRRHVFVCAGCWEEVRDNPARTGALAPTEHRQGMEDASEHCEVCGAEFDGDAVGGDDGEGWHTHKQCFEEGVMLGGLETDIQNGVELAERIGGCGGYFSEVLQRVPENCSLGEWVPFMPETVEDLDEGKACWITWHGVVQVIPAYWFAEEKAWLIHDHRLTEGVSHFMACPVPLAPEGVSR